MMKMFLQSCLVLCMAALGACAKVGGTPAQGVFLMSNQADNEIGVWHSADDGSLVWNGRYSTGGVGYPDPLDDNNFNDLSSSNALHYHVWGDRQLLVAANAGGPDNTPSVSLFEVDAYTLDLTLHAVAKVNGTFPCTATGHADKVCVAACAFNVQMECFRITEKEQSDDADSDDDGPSPLDLMPEFTHDFDMNLPEPEGRPNRVFFGLGPGNIAFAPDGDAIGVVMKGAHPDLAPEANDSARAGLWVFPIVASENNPSYQEPTFLEMEDIAIPFAFAWRRREADGSYFAFVVKAAGDSLDFPFCDLQPLALCYSTVASIDVDLNPALTASPSSGDVAMVPVDEVKLNAIDGCWIDYRNDYLYTGNFFSDSMSILKTVEDGTLDVLRTVPIGKDTVVVDIVTMGPKLDGSRYLYSENQGRRAVGVQQILPGGKLKVLPETATPTGPTPDAWNGAMGLAATTLSEQELFDLYDFKVSVSSSTSGDDTTSDCASSPGTFFLYALSTLMILSGFIN